MGRPDVICTPHLGASTREAQEEVAYEIAEAVISALKVRAVFTVNGSMPPGVSSGWLRARPRGS